MCAAAQVPWDARDARVARRHRNGGRTVAALDDSDVCRAARGGTVRARSVGMIEFAAGIMLGGSLGAIIMGALLAQTRASGVVRDASDLQAPAPVQLPRRSAVLATEHPRRDERLTARHALATRAAATPQLH
jgi:hypothetical protein